MSLCGSTGSKVARFTGQQFRVHTQPFAFRAPEEDDESVKMSNTTSCRANGVPPALLAALCRLEAAQANNFYSVQMNGFPQPRILQLSENKALRVFYSVQMESHQSLITNHQSLLTTHQSLFTKTRRTP